MFGDEVEDEDEILVRFLIFFVWDGFGDEVEDEDEDEDEILVWQFNFKVDDNLMKMKMIILI